MDYRIYLCGMDGRILAGESFSAQFDSHAEAIATSLHDACSDEIELCELWRGTECIAKSRNRDIRRGTVSFEKLVCERQEELLSLEEVLQNTFACLRGSSSLLDASARLRSRLVGGAS
jgi:hypothetical protein